MPFNQIKTYPDLLELTHLNDRDKKISLKKIFDRDVTENISFKFMGKQIRPIKIDGEVDLGRVFNHLITEEIEVDDEGNTYKKRVYERDRAHRLHWLKPHVNEAIQDEIEVFSAEERKGRKTVITTYIYNVTQKYVVVLEPQRSGTDYYLLTAYYLNKKYGVKMMKKKLKKRLPEVA